MTLTEALRALHRAGRIGSPWLPGMLRRDEIGRHARLTGLYAPYPTRVGPLLSGGEYDLTDPATVGCLLQLLREAAGRSWICAEPTGDARPGLAWRTRNLTAAAYGPTEGEALAAALVALAESL